MMRGARDRRVDRQAFAKEDVRHMLPASAPVSSRQAWLSRSSFRGLAVLGLAALSGCAQSDQVHTLVAERISQMYGESERWRAPPDYAHRYPLPVLTENSDLDAYVRFGLLNNAKLRAVFDRWRSAMERIPQAVSLPDPRFSFMYFVQEVQTRTGPQRSRFMLSQMFPWFGKLRLRGEVAALQAESLWWKVQTRRLALVREIEHVYYEYAYLAHAIRITAESLELLQQLEPVVQRKVQAGADQAGLLRLQVEIGKLDDEVRSLRQFRPALSARLSAVLNRQGKGLLPWPKAAPIAVLPLKQEELLKRLARQNPELETLRQQILRERKRVELARLSGRPDFKFGMGLIDTRSTSAAGSGDDPVAVTLSLNIPIWREKYRAAAREAQAARDAARAELLDHENQLSAELERQLFKLDDAERQISLYRDTLIPRARQALRVTQTSYLAGRASVLDLIDSERTLLMFEKAYWRANSDYAQSLADIEALCGGDVR